MRFVVDASLIVKTFIREPDSDLAELFVGRFWGQLDAPDLLLIELGKTLVRLTNDRHLTAGEASDGLDEIDRWREGYARLHRLTPRLVAHAARLAIGLGHPIADCVYLALADQLGCALATSDVKFRDRVADAGRVKLLAELV